MDTAPSSASRTVSKPNVEKVVSAPQKPVPTSASTQSGPSAADTAPAVSPSTSEPTAFTVNVPHGIRLACRDCTHRSTR